MKLFLCIAILFFVPSVSATELVHDGRLRLYHSHLNEFLEIQYEKAGAVDEVAMQKISQLFRSRDAGEIKPIDLRLIELLDHLQDYFDVDTVEVISGYRSPAFNARLKAEGRNVAAKSHHIEGLAADIHLDEVREADIMDYARKLDLGGVGYYPKLLMVHLDFGAKDFWQESQFEERTDIGIFNSALPVHLMTNKLSYAPTAKQNLVFTEAEGHAMQGDLHMEHFFRGKWREIGLIKDGLNSLQNDELTLTLLAKPFLLGESRRRWLFDEPIGLPYGKLRWKVFTKEGDWQNSNEFYLKKI